MASELAELADISITPPNATPTMPRPVSTSPAGSLYQGDGSAVDVWIETSVDAREGASTEAPDEDDDGEDDRGDDDGDVDDDDVDDDDVDDDDVDDGDVDDVGL